MESCHGKTGYSSPIFRYVALTRFEVNNTPLSTQSQQISKALKGCHDALLADHENNMKALTDRRSASRGQTRLLNLSVHVCQLQAFHRPGSSGISTCARGSARTSLSRSTFTIELWRSKHSALLQDDWVFTALRRHVYTKHSGAFAASFVKRKTKSFSLQIIECDA